MGVIALGIIFFEMSETKSQPFEELDERHNGCVGVRSFRHHQFSMAEPLRRLSGGRDDIDNGHIAIYL